MSFNKIPFTETPQDEDEGYATFQPIQPDSLTQRIQDLNNPGPANHQQANQQFLPILPGIQDEVERQMPGIQDEIERQMPGIQDEIERQIIPADHQQANQV